MKGKRLLASALLLGTVLTATGCAGEQQEEQTEPKVITSPSGVPASTDGE